MRRAAGRARRDDVVETGSMRKWGRQLTVADNGPGNSAADATIVHAYYSTKGAEAPGLAWCAHTPTTAAASTDKRATRPVFTMSCR